MLLFPFLGSIQGQTMLLRSVSHRNPPFIDYWRYDENNKPESIICTSKDSATVFMFYHFKRDKNHLLLTTDVKDVSYSTIYLFNYYYNSAKQVERIEKLSDTDYDRKADDLDQVFTFQYDSIGRVVNLKIRNRTVLQRDFTFTWKDGNVVHVDNTDGELNYHMDLQYDTIVNMLEPIKWEYIATTGTLEFFVAMFSKNNIIHGAISSAIIDTSQLNIYPEYDMNGMYKANKMEGVEYEYIRNE